MLQLVLVLPKGSELPTEKKKKKPNIKHIALRMAHLSY